MKVGHHRMWLWIVLTVIFAVLVGGAVMVYPFFRASWIQSNYTRLGSNVVTFSLEPSSVRPGESFSVVANFEKAYHFGNQGWYQELHITNSAGQDAVLMSNALLKQVGYTSSNANLNDFNQAVTAAAKVIDNQSGLFLESNYLQLQNRKSNPNSFYLEDVGCPLGLGPPSEPPKQYTDRLTFVVLPKTPPGQYTVLLKPGTYCNGLPIGTTSLTLMVLPK